MMPARMRFEVPTKISTAVSVALFALTLAGCAARRVEIDPIDPVAMPSGWSGTAADRNKPNMPAASAAQPPAVQTAPDADWWKRFGSDELTALVREGQDNNYEIAAAVSRVRQAEVQARIAGAPLLPSVDFSTSLARDVPFSSGAGSTSASSMLQVGYEVDFWGKNRAGLAAAEASYRANVYDRATVALTVTSSIVSTYLQVLSLRDRLDIVRNNVANAERVLTLVQAQSRAGAASPLDLARQRSAVAGQRAGLPDLQQQERAAEITLAILLGRPPQSFSVAQAGLAGIVMPDIAPGLPSELLARRPDIQRAEARLAEANANVAVARAALFPSIRLTGSTGAQSNALLNLFNGPNLLASLGVALTAPIFDNGLLANQRELAIAQKQELVQVYRSSVINALSEVEKTLGQIDSLAQRYQLKRTEVDQARVAFELSEIRYRIGAEDLMTVLDTQRSLSDADTALGQIKLERLQAVVSLYKALGGGWQDATTAITLPSEPVPSVPAVTSAPSGEGAIAYPVLPR